MSHGNSLKSPHQTQFKENSVCSLTSSARPVKHRAVVAVAIAMATRRGYEGYVTINDFNIIANEQNP